MFGAKHYVPILKWKAAERQALQQLSAEEKGLITPLIQIIMPGPKGLKKGERKKSSDELFSESLTDLGVKLPGLSAEILKFWGSAPAFIDVSLVHVSLREKGFTEIITTGKRMGMFLIPVISFSLDLKTQATAISLAKANKHGLCLRLSRYDFYDKNDLNDKIYRLLSTYKLAINEIDLLIDFQDGQCMNLSELCQNIPNLSKWRTFTFACGSFPVDLTKLTIGKHYISRSDWNNWVGQIMAGELKRVPSFGDYTIMHPIHKYSYQFFTPSASIRYTLKDNWLVMRGQKGKSVQYLAYAQLLSKEGEFFGGKFSYGDYYITEKGKDLKGKPGSATTWLIAGINHHLACTVSQIASLP